MTFYYLLLSGLLRFFVEWIRTDPLYIPGTSLRISMIVSALLVVGSVIALILLNRRQQRIELAEALAADSSRSDGEMPDDFADQPAGEDNPEKPDFIPLDVIDEAAENKQKNGPQN